MKYAIIEHNYVTGNRYIKGFSDKELNWKNKASHTYTVMLSNQFNIYIKINNNEIDQFKFNEEIEEMRKMPH